MSEFRNLTQTEIEVLENNVCWAEDWQRVMVAEDFKPYNFHRVIFYGDIRLGAFNKIDAYTWVEKEEDDLTPATKENVTLEELEKTWMGKLPHPATPLFISAKQKENIDELRETLYKRVRELHVQKYPYHDFLYEDIENHDTLNIEH